MHVIFADLLQYYNMWLSLAGALLCVFVMFIISWWTALITLASVLALYLIVAYRKPGIVGSCTLSEILIDCDAFSVQLS
jgi:solute carrier family 12 sodium/potassium/chloride transporter 2